MAQSTANERQSYLKRILRLLTEPSPMLQSSDQRRQAQFLAALTLFIFPISLLLTLMRVLITGRDLQHESSFYGGVLTAALAGITYFLSRGRYYRLASFLIVTISSVATLMLISINPNPDRLDGAIYLTIPVLLSGILLSMTATVVVIGLQVIVLVVISAVLPSLDMPQTLLRVLSYYLIASFMILLVTLHRKLIEQDRQRELQESRDQLAHTYSMLEQHVHDRTVKLLEANNYLKQQIVDREQAEDALAQERTLLRTLIDNLPDHIFVMNRRGEYILNNQAHSQMMASKNPDEIRGETVYDVFSQEQAAVYYAQEQKVMDTGEVLLNLEQSWAFPSGEERIYLINKIPLRDSSEKIVGLIGVGRDITERKRAEIALQQANNELEWRVAERTAELSQANYLLQQEINERLQAEEVLRYQASLLQNVSDAIIGTDMQYVIRSWNPAAEATYGWKAEEVIGRGIVEVLKPIHTSDDGYENVAGDFLKDGFWQGEISHIRKDGHRISVLASSSFIRDSEGKPEGIVGVNRDISQRKQIEAAEREQRVLAESLRDSASTINSSLNLDEVLDRILVYLARVMNYDAATIMLLNDGEAYVVHGRGFIERGLKMEDVLALRFPIVLHSNLREMYESEHAVVIPSIAEHSDWLSTDQTSWIRSYVGAPIMVEKKVIGFINLDSGQTNIFDEADAEKLQAFADQAGIAIRNARMFEEIRSHAEDMEARVIERAAELDKERAHLHTILDSMTEGVVGQMFDGDLVTAQYVNKALENLMGYPAKDWNFQLLKPNYRTPEQYRERLAEINEVIKHNGIWTGEGRIQRRDGSSFDASITATRIDGPKQEAIGTVTIIRDVSQEKALQEQKSRFVANASHELRTPITNLMTRLYLLRKQPERLEDHLNVIENVTQRMRDLVENLLDHSRFERGIIPLERQMIDMNKLIENVIHVQEPEAQKRGITLSTLLLDMPLMIYADSGRMTQVMTNLVTNAIHYTKSGGWVEVVTRIEQEADQDFAVIEVKDSGIGITAEALPNIFTPFYRSSEDSKGAGLGLSITRDIIKMHDGEILVQSEPGIGSQFTLKFPLTHMLPNW